MVLTVPVEKNKNLCSYKSESQSSQSSQSYALVSFIVTLLHHNPNWPYYNAIQVLIVEHPSLHPNCLFSPSIISPTLQKNKRSLPLATIG